MTKEFSKLEIRKIFAGVLFVISASCLVLSPAALAATGLVPCRGLDCEFSHLGQLLINIYNFSLGLAGIVAILFVVYGGFLMVYGWTTEQPESTYKEGQLTVRRAIWGLVLIIAAYLVVNTLVRVIFGAEDINTYFNKIFPGV